MKKFVNPFTKKVISAVLALAVVLCSVTVALSAFAEDSSAAAEAYEVNWRSPAIPMYERTVLDLSNVDVQLTQDGEFTKGNSLVWALETSDPGVVLDGNKLSVISAGKYKLTATKDDTSLNVWVIANKSGQKDFYLENLDFSDSSVTMDNFVGGNGGDRNIYPTTGSFGNAFGGEEIANNALTTSNLQYSSSAVVYKSEILKDFADYTVDVSLKLQSAKNDWAKTENGSKAAIGIIARATPADSAAFAQGTTALMARFGNTGGVGLVGIGDTAVPFGGNTGVTSLTSLDDVSGLKYSAASHEKTLWQDGAYNRRNISLKLSENGVVYTLDSNVIFDSSKSSKKITIPDGACDNYTSKAIIQSSELTDEEKAEFAEKYPNASLDVPADSIYWIGAWRTLSTNKKVEDRYPTTGDAIYNTEDYNSFAEDLANANTGKGTFGISIVRAALAVYKMSAKLNDPVVPTTEAMNVYTIDSNNPFVPMTAGTQISTSRIMLTVDSEPVLGSTLEWTSSDATGLAVDGTTLKALKKGVYTLTSADATVYVVVKNADETAYTVFDGDYRSAYDADGNARTDYDYWRNIVVDESATKAITMLDTEKSNVNYNTADALANEHDNVKNLKAKGFTPYTASTLCSKFTDLGGGYHTAYTLTDSELVRSLSDYTVTAKLAIKGSPRSNIGLVGRTSVDLDAPAKTVRNGFAVSSSDTWDPVGVYTFTGANVRTQIADGSSAWVKMLNSQKVIVHTYTLAFNGDKMTYSVDNMPEESRQLTADASQTKGDVGIAVLDRNLDGQESYMKQSFFAIQQFTVTANADDSVLEATPIAGYDPEAQEKVYYTPDSIAYTTQENLKPTWQNIIYNVIKTVDNNKPIEKFVAPTDVNGTAITGFANCGTNSYATTADANIFGNKRFEVAEVDLSNTAVNSAPVCIGASAFYGTSALDKVILPEVDVRLITRAAFMNNTELTTVENSEYIVDLGDWAFNNCSSLKEFKIGSKVSAISELTFGNCISLTHIDVPSNVTSINEKAFQSCASLYDVKLNEGLKTIGASAFSGCTNLTELVIPASVTSIATGSIPTTTTLRVYVGSYGYDFAVANGYNYEVINETKNFYGEGATINEELSGLRFATLTDLIKQDGTENAGVWATDADGKVKLNVNGSVVTVTPNALGAIVIPKALLNDGETTVKVDAATLIAAANSDTVALTNARDGILARNVAVTSINSVTADYATYNVTLTGILDTMKSQDIVMVSYVIYTDAEGNRNVFIGSEMTKNYTDIATKAAG